MKLNPSLYTVWFFCYVNPLRVHAIDYSMCHWYKEGKVSHSGYDKVIAYYEGYKTEFDVKAFRFRNVGTTEAKIMHLINNELRAKANKYPGWQHHINIYPQIGIKPKVIRQILL